MGDKFLITKEGKLLKKYWKYDNRKKEGKYLIEDITDCAASNLWAPINLQKGVTLRSIFNLVSHNLEVFELILDIWIKEIVEEGIYKYPKKVGIYDKNEIEFLLLKKAPFIGSPEERTDYIDFEGVGFKLKEDYYDHYLDGSKYLMYKKGDRIKWGISLTPVNELIDLPLKLDRTLRIYSESLINPPSKETFYKFKGVSYTLGDMLYWIFYELSWYGKPKDRDKKSKELFNLAEEAKKELKKE